MFHCSRPCEIILWIVRFCFVVAAETLFISIAIFRDVFLNDSLWHFAVLNTTLGSFVLLPLLVFEAMDWAFETEWSMFHANLQNVSAMRAVLFFLVSLCLILVDIIVITAYIAIGK